MAGARIFGDSDGDFWGLVKSVVSFVVALLVLECCRRMDEGFGLVSGEKVSQSVLVM